MTKLSSDLIYLRSARPDEETMDRFISKAVELESQIAEIEDLLAYRDRQVDELGDMLEYQMEDL